MRQLKIIKTITLRDSNSMDKYLVEIGRYDLISAQQEVELARIIHDIELDRKDRDDAIIKLVNANLRFVVSVAKQYQNQGLSLPDLINEGNLGLIKSAARFDETRGFKFISYAVWWIRQSIMQSINEQARIVRVPLNQTFNVSKYFKSIIALEQELNRNPTIEEIANKMEMSMRDVKKIEQNAINKRHSSIDAPIAGTDDLVLGSVIEDDLYRADQSAYLESLQIEIERALTILPDRMANVLRLFFGLNGKMEMTLEDIGKEYDLTRERVRQLKEKGIQLIRESSKNELLKKYLG